jgi:hypothetical protein
VSRTAEGVRRHTARHDYPSLVPKPAPINWADIVAVVQKVMSTVHPLAVTQQQILRAAFFTQLSHELAIRIGTGMSAVHPERPTPTVREICEQAVKIVRCHVTHSTI